MKNMILLVALPFILGCTATAQTTPSKQPKTNRVETFSQLDSTEPAERPNWLQIVPESDEGFYFVGMSTKRTEKRNARNESFNDALIGFARYCGLNVQYLSEHRDTSMGGDGGLINTFSKGNTVAKMQAEMLLGNIATKDRYTEKYSTFYGGSFMGHAFVDATLIYVPKTEMNLCKENRKQANTFLAQKTKKIKQLEVKNEILKKQLVVEKQNTNVALAQAQQSSEFFKQVLNKPVVKKIEPIKEEAKEVVVIEKQPTGIKQSNETVVNTSGLMWSKKVISRLGIVYNWHDAKQYCNSLSTNNYLDWRLPNLNELTKAHFIIGGNNWDWDSWYWSATESNSDMATNLSPDISKTTHAFRVWLGTGDVTSNIKVGKNYVRCVRDSKKIASL